jgi:opacity protein-like surface antigen
MRRFLAIVSLFLLVAAVSANAQEKKVNFDIGGGVTFPLSDVKDHFGTGYNFTLGLTFNINPVVGLRADWIFNGLGSKSISIPPAIPTDPNAQFDANHWMQAGLFDIVLRPAAKENGDGFYILAGLGVYGRKVEVTTPSVGYVPGFCDPWWYVCYPGGLVPVDKVIGSRSSTDMGINVGAGVAMKAFFVEARYHYMWGPSFTDQNGNTVKANGQYFPLTFGFRF